MIPTSTQSQGRPEACLARRLPEIYLAVAFLICSLLCLLTPPFFVPDEAAHAEREMQIAHGEIVGQNNPKGVGGKIDANAREVMVATGSILGKLMERYPDAAHRPDGRVTQAELDSLREIRWSGGSVFAPFQNTAAYPPPLYLAQALGWRVGEAANLTILHSLLLARALAALSAIAAGWLALRISGDARWILFAYLLLPSTLSLNASCSQDALLLPAVALLLAILSRPLEARRLFTGAELVAASALLVACVAARPPYLPLALLLLLPCLLLEDVQWRQYYPAGVAMLVIVCTLAAWQAFVHPLGAFHHPAAEPALQAAFLRNHPGAGATAILKSAVFLTPLMTPQVLEVLGFLDVFAPPIIYLMLAAGFAGIVLLAPNGHPASRRARGTVLFVIAAVCVAMTLAEYLIFTPPGAGWVFGLQGRYYLPLVPLWFLLLGRNSRTSETAVRSSSRLRSAFHMVALLIFLCGVLYTPWVAARGFYNLALVPALRATVSR